ncbi:hypothetical protein NQ315_017177 [Exocentrus adspersus]|uniref:Inorganic phosphate cotransporter n=1 Tax=Exocentrus adspersus TaxID=1586481 RepID=A0AAV8VGV0_9CUCU|nr:hypothetical protein NQ315_017177 [Exocentrus adspersus]
MCATEKNEIEEVTYKGGCSGVRYLQYILYFIVLNVAYGIRSVLSVAIYAMISKDPPSADIPAHMTARVGVVKTASDTSFAASSFPSPLRLLTAVATYPEWTSMKNIMLSSFFWGYICFQIGAGQLAKNYGPKLFLGGTTLIGSLFCLLIPIFGEHFGYAGVIACRVLTGPSKHPSITDEEKKYIEAGLQNEDDKENIPTPWKAIFTSLPFWAILITHCGQNWGFWTLFTEIPSYMQNILNFNIASNSTLSALPYLVLWLLSLVLSPIADYLIVRNFTIGASRKIFNSIGLYTPALALISLSFVGTDQKALTVAILVIGVGFNAAIFCGYHINHMDLSPVHAGTLMGITNCFANVFSLLGPLAVDAIKAVTGYEETDKALWTIVFCTAAGVFMAVATFYNFAATGEVQPWNNTEERKEKRTNEKIV